MAAPETVIIGRRRTTPDDFYGDMGPNQIRAYVTNNAPDTAWVRRARYRGGRIGSGTPRVRVVVYDTAGSGPAPDDRMYIFPSTYPDARMDDARGGELITVAVASSDKGFLVNGGANYALALQVNDHDFRHNMVEAADISGENEQFYYKNASSPPDPFGSSTVSTEGWITLWLEGDKNLAPLKPINVAPSGTVLSVTPAIEADFRDPNGKYGATAYGTAGNFDAGDYLQSARVQVRRKSDFVSFWDHTYTATSGERTTNRSTRTYAGTTLVRGTTYQVRVQHFDRAGAASPWSDWVDFIPSSLGVVTVNGPSGKVNDLTPDLSATWNHQGGLSADRVKVKFYRPGITAPVSQTTADWTVSFANGSTNTIPWASLTGVTPLQPGQEHQVTVEMRDTDGVWSQPSARRTFRTDAAPGVPTSLSPANDEVKSTATYPILSAKIEDADDTNASGLIGKVEILNSGGSLISTRTATLRAGTTNIYEYQTTSADLASAASYRHRWYAFDGYLYSGGVEVEASATRSAEALFSWANVPSPVITGPLTGVTISTIQPSITWTVTNQDKFRVRVLEGGAEVYNSGWIPNTAARDFLLPIGKTRNGGLYDIEVGVEYATLQGFDTETNILVSYPTPESLGNFQVLPSTVNLEPIPTAAVGTWDRYVGDWFHSYVIFRSDLGSRPFLILTNPDDTTFTDWHAPDGVVYSGVVNELRGLDEIVSSEPVSMNFSLTIRGVVLVSLASPQVDRYVNLSWEAIDWVQQGEESTYFTWGATAPIAKRGIADYFEGAHEFKLDAQLVDPEAARAALEALAKSTGFSYRDRYDRRFVTIPAGSLKLSRVRGGGYTGGFTLRGLEVIEGEPE